MIDDRHIVELQGECAVVEMESQACKIREGQRAKRGSVFVCMSWNSEKKRRRLSGFEKEADTLL